jgi:hypothetical protein
MVTNTGRFQLNRRTAAQWTAANTVLLAGELGVETDTHKVKGGDGSTAWTALPYVGDASVAGVATVNGRSGTVTLAKADVGLSAVDNTADTAKPVSTAQAAALAAKISTPAGGVDGQALVKSGTGAAWATITGGSTPLVVTNSQTGTAYTLAASDADKVIEQNSASTLTVTVPANATVGFPVGTVIEFNLYGTGSLTIAPASGVTLRSPAGLRLTTRYASAAIRKRATDEWIVAGATTV